MELAGMYFIHLGNQIMSTTPLIAHWKPQLHCFIVFLHCWTCTDSLQPPMLLFQLVSSHFHHCLYFRPSHCSICNLIFSRFTLDSHLKFLDCLQCLNSLPKGIFQFHISRTSICASCGMCASVLLLLARFYHPSTLRCRDFRSVRWILPPWPYLVRSQPFLKHSTQDCIQCTIPVVWQVSCTILWYLGVNW